MNFVNNWSQAISLAAGEESLAGITGLPDGDYILTLADSAVSPTRWEVVQATLAGGSADLVRAQEGTTDQTWPVGSVIYCSLTASTLLALQTAARGIVSTTVDGTGHLQVTYTDGETVDAGFVKGTKGDTGDAGRGISGVTVNSSGHLIISYTSGANTDAGMVVGPTGRGIESSTVDGSGHLILTYTDGSTQDVGDVTNGIDGEDGEDGADGRGIASAAVDSSGHLVLTYTDSSTQDVGSVKGDPGPEGPGDVVGPASSVDGEVALFSGTTGKLLKRGVFGDLVRATVASGLSLATAGVIVAGDTFLVIVGKLQRQISDLRAVTIPITSKSVAYTLVAADAGTAIFHPSADTTARVWTIPAGVFDVGAAVTFDNDAGAGAITITAASGVTLVQVGTGATGARTLAAGGQATAIMVAANRWRISGNGLA